MPAQSKQQQKFMGMVHALKKGDMDPSDASPELKKAADSMSDTDAKDFASTPHKGLPKRVKQEIVRKLKEYAMTLPGHHAKSAAPMDSLRSDDEMDVQETRIPQNFNVGTTQDYHTKLSTTPRKKYDKTNFDPEHSGQEDLEEAGLKGTENIPSNKKLSQLSDNEKLNILQSGGNIISFHIPDWAKGRYKMWQVISAGKIKKQKSFDGEIIYFLPGKGPQKASPTYKSVKDLINGVDWDTMELRRESVNEVSPSRVKYNVGDRVKIKDGYPRFGGKEAKITGYDKFHNNKNSFELYIKGHGRISWFSPTDLRKIDESVNEAQAVSGGKVHKFITGKNLKFKGKSYSEIDFETLGVDNKNQTIRLKIIAPKEIFGNEMSLDFRTVRRGPFLKTDTSKVNEGCWKGYKQVGGKMKNGRMVPNCVPESVNESPDTNSLKKIHDAVLKFLKTKKGVGEVKEFPEFPNRYGDNVSTFSVKYNIEDKYNYDLQEIKIQYSTSRVFIPNKGYFPFKTFNDIKNIINKKSSLKESIDEASKSEIIKDLDKAKNDLLKKVDVLIAKKKKLYSDVDIESPMTADEKKLDKDIADLFSQINKLVLQKRNLKEYASNLDNSYILNKDVKLDGTPEDKKAIGEELSFDEKQMVVGIIEILKQVEDRKNRMKIALNMLKKFKEEGIEFDYQKFIDHLKEYSMGSYEYDKGNRELGEAMIWQAKDMIYKVIPKSTFARYANNPPKNREFVDSIIRDLTQVLNRFYKQNDIDLVLK